MLLFTHYLLSDVYSWQVGQLNTFKHILLANWFGTPLSFFSIVSDLPHTVMLLTHADDLLCLQLHTVGSPHTVMLLTHADDLLCLQLHTVGSPYTVMLLTHADDLLCLQLHTVGSPYTIMLLTHADDLLCLQLHTVGSPYTAHASNPCWWLAVPTAARTFKVLVVWHGRCYSTLCRLWLTWIILKDSACPAQ